MNSISRLKQQWKTLWPGRAVAGRRLLLIALVLFPLTWIADALLVGTLDILEDRNAEAFRHITQASIIFILATCVVFLVSLLPTFHRFSQWLFSPRTVRRGFILLAWVVTCIVLFYVVEDWRGRRSWSRYSESLIAQGEDLDFKTFIPAAIPDADNFAANPEVQSWFIRITNSDRYITVSNHWDEDNFERAQTLLSDTNPFPRHLADLAGWQRAFDAVTAGHTNESVNFYSDKLDLASRAQAAPAVLDALKPMDNRLEELRAASQRPDSLYPVVYMLDNPWGILLYHLKNLRQASDRLDLRACAELATGQSNRALDDVKLILRLGDSLNKEPFLISYLVRVRLFHIAVHPVWEGLAEHRWSDAQLRELQTLLERFDFIADMKRPFDGERAAGILTADLLAEGKYQPKILFDGSSNPGTKAANVFAQSVPQGWYEMEKLTYTRLYNLQLDGAFDVHQTRVFPGRIESNSIEMGKAMPHRNLFSAAYLHHQLLSEVMLPALKKVPMKGAFGQVAANQAVLACALERYRLAHGQFPEKLNDLMPDFISTLPHDVVSGEDYKYRRTQNGSFVLYSIGWNEKDDDGATALKDKSMDTTQGDWVWEYPAE
ncbi:MAG TPA: hypothetical protein VKV04_20835 [Verrucomicrobiae bacterium]|nr:hypothetical protein [Verrucomicrobiae bacterium]